MSRFNATGTFTYDTNAAGTVSFGATGTLVYLNANQMPQYPFEAFLVTDMVSYRSKGGTLWSYSNYAKRGYNFNWTLLDESMRGTLWNMALNPCTFTFDSGANFFGTFRIEEGSWAEEEVLYGLYDISFRAVPV